ncbi:MAG: DUF58 domain-containing protein [Candidatus Thiodiazotropha taylori]|nr:DUF58 domain-containing protein [Candidatus Thiodiazotropha taylori]MCG7944615.1 DUF58 domain-containing protein [Candidatus Thiodiazotropha taylori]MCG7960878.1 DUF58 domain-containing protein [Candidatus Thiodiazotropha taylori]MCG7972731.1 DUF58 domain-containing protein [Candidatus Thiodiazotropha taylori]MCG7973947.1 DUF58 domain-containing protein [Candidatus Thiodiazotropha taylori]
MSLHPHIDDLLELRHQAHTLGLASHHLVNTSFSGLYASVFRGTGLDFEEVREYREGDDIRNMEWNVTARTNVPHMKIFREERERSVVLCIDRGPHMSFGTRGTFKSVQAAKAAALLGWAASRLHDRVGGMLFGDLQQGMQYFQPTKDRRALWRLLHALTHEGTPNQPNQDCLSEALQRADKGTSTGSLIFVIADLNREVMGLQQTLGRLCQHHTVVLIPVDDPADRELPEMGRVTFVGPDGHAIEIDTRDRGARSRYAETWQKHRNELNAMANALGISLMPITTNEEIHLTLTRGLAQHFGRH